MILQHVVLPGSGLDNTGSLYSSSYFDNFPIVLNTEKSIDFFGYFNYFALDRWCKYIDPKEIFLEVHGVGEVDVEFCIFHDAIRFYSEHHIINIQGQNQIHIPDVREGLLGIRLTAISDSTLDSISYVCNSNMCVKIRIAINVCTYHREEFIDYKVDAFMYALSSYMDLSGNMELFIIDNGSTIPPDKYDSECVHILYHENTGGSGGFTYGVEVISDKEMFTHILFMDDDTVVDPETLYRTWSFLTISNLKDSNIILGGAMFSLDEVCKVVEGSSSFIKGKMYPNKCGIDCSSLSGCIDMIREDDANYNGWWYCVYPITYANRTNLPLQLFVKMDDVEYGARSNLPVVTLNGISVWHLDFNKKYSTSNVYYTLRNTLLISKKMNILNLSLKIYLLKKIISDIFCLKYKNVELSIRALSDYLKGYDWISKQDAKLNETIMSSSYIFEKKILKLCDTRKDAVCNHNTVLRLLTFNGIFLKHTCSLPVETVNMSSLYGVKIVDYYNCEGMCFREHRDPIKAIKLLITAIFYMYRVK